MDIKNFDAASAYARASQALQSGGADKADAAGEGQSGFTQLLEDSLKNVRDTSERAETASAQAVRGEGNLVDVVTAVSDAENTVNTVVRVRDKILESYNRIMRMPI
ncbi:flagellar hook-basal body complex protein FliE [Yunchengibacter salinarum]|uniref:flagellar hook-basal body complex protein FliE n=1 Tax=Yunchengibacter salinarum TaxID=3133399 RepID=UPI0035B5839B